MKVIIPILIAFMVFSSCGHQHSEKVRTIDSLLILMDSAAKTLTQLDSGKLFKYRRDGAAYVQQIRSLTTNLSKEDALVLDQFLGIHRAFRKWSERVPDYYEEIYIVPQQLEDLKHDLSRGLIKEEDISDYFDRERLAAISLFESIVAAKTGLESVEPRYLENEEKIIALIQRLEAEKQVEI
jgi:hypothetical protein